jgi:hypothetical protein
MPKDDKTIPPIDAKFDEVAGSLAPPTAPLKNKSLSTKLAVKVPPPQSSIKGLPLFECAKEKEVDGVGMGVLTNGMPYLTGGGLAKLCGVEPKVIRTISQDWEEEKKRPRGKIIAGILEENKYIDEALYVQVHTIGDQYINAYPDLVCMAFLEYYAFEAKKEEAILNYRTLARKTLRDFIYISVGYDPEKSKIDSWKYYHDRVSILQNKVPDGYFSIFNEIAGMTVDLIMSGFVVSDKNIPDISVGLTWATYWKENNLSSLHGDRIEYEHNYPKYYTQSFSNLQKPAAYPVSALGEFRSWFKKSYLTSKFPKYILKKANVLEGGKEEAERLIEVFNPKQLPRN